MSSAPAAATKRHRRSVAAAAAALAIAVALVGATLLAYRHGQSPTASSEQARLEGLRDRLLRERASGGADIPTVQLSPEEAEARRELQRLQRQLDQTMPGARSSDVRLRTGDTMPGTEYESLRRRARSLR